MEQGTLGELYLTRSVIKHIRKHNKEVVAGSGVGKDYSLIKTKADYMVQSEAVALSPYVAWIKALNNFKVSGGCVSGVRICYMLPVDTEEGKLKEYAGESNSLADKWRIQIVGGNTLVSSAYNAPSFLVEVLGTVKEQLVLPLKAKADYQIVMVGYSGILGTNLMVDKKKDQLEKRFAPSYVESCRFSNEDYSVVSVVEKAMCYSSEVGLVYMHDVSCGGVYGALWQLGEALKLGATVEHRSIPIRQETVEVCNYFDVNPYMLDGTGALLAVAKEGDKLAEYLSQEGYKSSVVGKLTQNKDRVVVLNDEGEKRFLAPIKGDEIYKVIAAY